ncbi:MAG: flagellar hook assembly protein FlgD [Deltaproteobacteria bacterium]|nr:flagellar hook assembly protein FlgD [Deltaproteobacteria bacterium]
MAISGVTSSSANAATTSTISDNVMGKEDFLTLLVAQLKNQDPLNPSDPTEFTAQLAQFSSLEQLFTVNKSLTEMVSGQSQSDQLAALQMIGKKAVFSQNSFRFNGEGVEIGYELTLPAQGVDILVRNASGQVVATLQGEELAAGAHFLTWNGQDDNGGTVPAGNYVLQINGSYDNKNYFSLDALLRSEVEGVDFGAEGTVLSTPNGDFGVADVKGVRRL